MLAQPRPANVGEANDDSHTVQTDLHWPDHPGCLDHRLTHLLLPLFTRQ
ncbi:hypothetical protein NTGHW29_650063 [Candidatus Nitrotoga sp. HW29]|nr:hypothetical protein NTGHW29_650063 [Candidatus Nitrotoga sp. HW29]